MRRNIELKDAATITLQAEIVRAIVACRHLPRLHDFLWLAEDGMKMQGYNGSQLWDTTFAVQAVAATGLAPEFAACLRRAHAYVEATQARRASPC